MAAALTVSPRRRECLVGCRSAVVAFGIVVLGEASSLQAVVGCTVALGAGLLYANARQQLGARDAALAETASKPPGVLQSDSIESEPPHAPLPGTPKWKLALLTTAVLAIFAYSELQPTLKPHEPLAAAVAGSDVAVSRASSTTPLVKTTGGAHHTHVNHSHAAHNHSHTPSPGSTTKQAAHHHAHNNSSMTPASQLSALRHHASQTTNHSIGAASAGQQAGWLAAQLARHNHSAAWIAAHTTDARHAVDHAGPPHAPTHKASNHSAAGKHARKRRL